MSFVKNGKGQKTHKKHPLAVTGLVLGGIGLIGGATYAIVKATQPKKPKNQMTVKLFNTTDGVLVGYQFINQSQYTFTSNSTFSSGTTFAQILPGQTYNALFTNMTKTQDNWTSSDGFSVFTTIGNPALPPLNENYLFYTTGPLALHTYFRSDFPVLVKF